MRHLLAILLVWTVLAVPATPGEGRMVVTKAEVMRVLARIAQVAPLREEMRALGFRGENLDLAEAQAAAFYTDPIIAGYIAERIMAVYDAPQRAGRAEGLIGPLARRGLGHLPTRRLAYYYRVERALVDALPVPVCGRAVRGQLSARAYSDAMSRVAARLNTPALREYYRIERRAAQLGAQRRAVSLSPRAAARIEARLNRALDRLIAAQPRPGRLRAAMRDLGAADNASACTIGRLMYAAMLAIEGPARRDAMIHMTLQ